MIIPGFVFCGDIRQYHLLICRGGNFNQGKKIKRVNLLYTFAGDILECRLRERRGVLQYTPAKNFQTLNRYMVQDKLLN